MQVNFEPFHHHRFVLLLQILLPSPVQCPVLKLPNWDKLINWSPIKEWVNSILVILSSNSVQFFSDHQNCSAVAIVSSEHLKSNLCPWALTELNLSLKLNKDLYCCCLVYVVGTPRVDHRIFGMERLQIIDHFFTYRVVGLKSTISFIMCLLH